MLPCSVLRHLDSSIEELLVLHSFNRFVQPRIVCRRAFAEISQKRPADGEPTWFLSYLEELAKDPSRVT